jgi:hypothetical protein
LIKASGMPVYPLVILWGGSKNARPSDPLAIGETPVADRPQAVRCWIEEIKRQPGTTSYRLALASPAADAYDFHQITE